MKDGRVAHLSHGFLGVGDCGRIGGREHREFHGRVGPLPVDDLHRPGVLRVGRVKCATPFVRGRFGTVIVARGRDLREQHRQQQRAGGDGGHDGGAGGAEASGELKSLGL